MSAPGWFKDLSLDANDPQLLADFWCAAMGYRRRDPDDREAPVLIEDPTGLGPSIWFAQVPEGKTIKNRMHHDVDGDTVALLALGATLVRARGGDVEWDVLADPEGNEFCVFAPE